ARKGPRRLHGWRRWAVMILGTPCGCSLLALLFLLEARVIQKMQVGLDVVRVGVYVRQEEIRDGGPADGQLLREPQDEWQFVTILAFKSFPPLAGGATGVRPVKLGLDLVNSGLDLLIAHVPDIGDHARGLGAAGRRIAGCWRHPAERLVAQLFWPRFP